MAVVRDVLGTYTDYSGSADTTTFDYTGLTIAAQSNLALLVQIGWGGTTGNPGATTVTWDFGGSNQACTEITTVSNGGTRRAGLWGLVNPATGNKTLRVVATNNVTCIIEGISYYNVDQTGGGTTFHNATSNTAAAAPVDITITSAVGELTVDLLNVPAMITTTTQTVLYIAQGAGPDDDASAEGTGAATVVHSWSYTGAAASVLVGCSIKEVGTPGPSGGLMWL